MNNFFVALRFLTILPIGPKQEAAKEDFGKSLIFFIPVGAIIGLFLASLVFLFGGLPQPVAAALIMIASIILTGGIHLDGFADTCDGLCGFTSREKALEIMRDSRIGAMGTAGMAALLLFKFSLLANMPRETLWKSLILMAAFARWAQVLACCSSKYAREDGKAKWFIEGASQKEALSGGLFTLALFILLMNVEGIGLFLILTFLAFLFISWINKKLGGMTGDTIGATSELSEALALFLILVFARI